MYGNGPPPIGVVVPGALAMTGIDGLTGTGLTLAALAMVISGVFLLRSAWLKRASESVTA